MKKILSIVLFVLLVSVPVYGVEGTVITPTPIKTIVHASANSTAIAGAMATGGNASIQKGAVTSSQSFEVQRDLMVAPTISPFEIPLLQGGRITNVTAAMPPVRGLTKYTNETLIDSVDADNGYWFSRNTIEDLFALLIAKGKLYKDDKRNLRYMVWQKSSGTGSGVGGGTSGSLSGGSGEATTLSILPGYHRSTADDLFTIIVVEIDAGIEQGKRIAAIKE